MLLFRVLCAIFVAWAMSIAFNRPEAAALSEKFPDFVALVPVVGALVGFVNLARRQGWGAVVAVANGIWAGFLTILLTLFVSIMVEVFDMAAIGDVKTDFIAGRMAKQAAETMDLLVSFPLMTVAFACAAVTGLLTEGMHWLLVKLRKRRGLRERNTRRAHRPSMY